MFSSLLSSSPLFLLSLLLFLAPPTAADLLYPDCGTTGNYTTNNTYDFNLRLLLSNLTTRTFLAGGYSNATIGQSPDQIFGLALCRGDVNTSSCRSCLNTASVDILRLCPNYKAAVIWYDLCRLRYANQDFLSMTDNNPQLFLKGVDGIPDGDLFDELVQKLVKAVTDWAAFNSTRKFATGEVNFTTAFPKIYGLAQCTWDLKGFQCQQCLQWFFGQIPSWFEGERGGTMLGVRCYLRYNVSKFYQEASILRLASQLVNATAPAAPHTPDREEDESIPEEITSVKSLLIDLSILRVATANFSDVNELGQGGFGTVYQGILPDGRQIAVKRLTISSRQGLEEMKNELALLAKLQHRNLVRLLGVCLEEQEKLLVYEYVPNRSLDTFLFDPIKSKCLRWGRRYKIIEGIARALQYLHEDSQLKIVHRDLKASNILLGADMNPKISDFGLARLFGGDQTEGTTSKVVGTLGYISPEYAMRGHFSTKSDVYSFGVLVLEIVTGRNNSDPSEDLLSYTWDKWSEGRSLEILDPALGHHCQGSEVLKCIQIGLLCVQDNPSDRPNMSTVVLMLNSNTVSHKAPSKPALCTRKSRGAYDHNLSRPIPMSPNEMSITELEPR
ncbi:cysteine-rich receptor-like protein kinase 6 isoform X2 [Elaeis guineensis]|uniref:Cysteine-rich receptor-like protein kinase 6 isoform X2 n=1 Tax=Elaeis guineensis var. tenera TaxID=51953 RepID=A0A6I9RSM6_ELAGV|nr:cysteine-rich receptor-like protein kinase 6 isoform X2 [Elaeis guineensis]